MVSGFDILEGGLPALASGLCGVIGSMQDRTRFG